MENMTELVPLINNMGFPIFIAVWSLFKQSKETNALKDAINQLTTAIALMTKEK